MLTDIEFLWRLQKIDNQIEELKDNQKVNGLNQKIDSLTEEIKELDKEIEAIRENKKEIKRTIKEKEFEDAQLERQEDNYEEQLYSGENSNPKELKQLNEKLDKVAVQKEELEDQLLDLMLEEEKLEQDISKYQEKLAAKEEGLEELEQEKEQQQQQLATELQDLKKERSDVEEEISEEVIAKYNRLYEKKNNRAVVRLKDGFCMGCRMGLPLNRRKEVKSGSKLVTCEQCGRILYWSK